MRHFCDPYNALDAACFISVALTGYAVAASPAGLLDNTDVAGLGAALLGLRVITYLRALEGFGFLVTMLIQVK